MPNTISRYILRRIIAYLLVMTLIALAALLLERSLRVVGLVAGWNGAIGMVFRMLINLIPHYLGIALPAAFFFGVLLTFSHLNRNSELAVLHASGLGLHRLVRPVVALALLLTLIAAVTFGFLQPYGRYAYRALAHAVTNVSLSLAVQAGKFLHVDNLTFMAESITPSGGGLRRVFVYERQKDGGSVTTTAREGVFTPSPEGRGAMLVLHDGMRMEVRADGRPVGTLSFAEYRWPIESGEDFIFRDRGKDERELTLPELWQARSQPPPGISRAELLAELHARIVHILSVLFLPFLAMTLGLGGIRGGRAYGIALGLVILVLYEQLLQFGHSMVQLGRISPWLALWVPFALFAAGSLVLFVRASFHVTRGAPQGPMGRIGEALQRLGRALTRRAA